MEFLLGAAGSVGHTEVTCRIVQAPVDFPIGATISQQQVGTPLQRVLDPVTEPPLGARAFQQQTATIPQIVRITVIHFHRGALTSLLNLADGLQHVQTQVVQSPHGAIASHWHLVKKLELVQVLARPPYLHMRATRFQPSFAGLFGHSSDVDREHRQGVDTGFGRLQALRIGCEQKQLSAGGWKYSRSPIRVALVIERL